MTSPEEKWKMIRKQSQKHRFFCLYTCSRCWQCRGNCCCHFTTVEQEGRTVLQVAFATGDLRLCHKLVEAGAALDHTDQVRSLKYTVTSENLDNIYDTLTLLKEYNLSHAHSAKPLFLTQHKLSSSLRQPLPCSLSTTPPVLTQPNLSHAHSAQRLPCSLSTTCLPHLALSQHQVVG